MSARFAQLPYALQESSWATPCTLAVYGALQRHVDWRKPDEPIWPGLDTLARLAHMEERQVRRELERLEAHEWITRVTRGNVGKTNRYIVHKAPKHTGLEVRGTPDSQSGTPDSQSTELIVIPTTSKEVVGKSNTPLPPYNQNNESHARGGCHPATASLEATPGRGVDNLFVAKAGQREPAPPVPPPPGRRANGTNPRAMGTNPRARTTPEKWDEQKWLREEPQRRAVAAAHDAKMQAEREERERYAEQERRAQAERWAWAEPYRAFGSARELDSYVKPLHDLHGADAVLPALQAWRAEHAQPLYVFAAGTHLAPPALARLARDRMRLDEPADMVKPPPPISDQDALEASLNLAEPVSRDSGDITLNLGDAA